MVGENLSNDSSLSGFKMFWKVLKLYLTSICKLARKEFLVVLVASYSIKSVYKMKFSEIVQISLDNYHAICSNYADVIQITFVVAFFVFLLVNRWWTMYFLMPTINTLAPLVNAAIPVYNKKGKVTRKTIVRYAHVSYILVLREISEWMNKKFPTLQSVVDAGFLLENEASQLKLLQESGAIRAHTVPLVWAINIVYKNCKEQMVNSDSIVQTLVTELVQHHHKLKELIVYSIVPMPIVYLQIASICTVSYLFLTQLGCQLFESSNMCAIVINLLSGLSQYILYLAWLEAAGLLSNPFDEDDEDFEFNKKMYLNLKAGYIILNEIQEDPALERLSVQYESIRSLYSVDISQPNTVREHPDVTVKENETNTFLNQEDVGNIFDEICKVDTPNKPMYDYACGFTQPERLSIHTNSSKDLDTLNINNSEFYPVYEQIPLSIQPVESDFEVERKVNALRCKGYNTQRNSLTKDLSYYPTSLNHNYENIKCSVYDNTSTKLHYQYDIASNKDDIYESVDLSSNQIHCSAKPTQEEQIISYMCEETSPHIFYRPTSNCSNFTPKLASGQESNQCNIKITACDKDSDNNYNSAPPMHLVHSLNNPVLDSENTSDLFQAVDDHLTCNNTKTEINSCVTDDKSEQEENSTHDNPFNTTRELIFYKEFEITI